MTNSGLLLRKINKMPNYQIGYFDLKETNDELIESRQAVMSRIQELRKIKKVLIEQEIMLEVALDNYRQIRANQRAIKSTFLKA